MRKAIFDAIKAARGGKAFNAMEVGAIDNLLDALGVARDDAPASRQINGAGLAIIKRYEGCELKAYLCPAGVPTVGYGHTGPDVKLGMVIDEAQAEALLKQDLARFERAVARLCPVATDNQFSALVSFAFNVGEEALRASTLRRKHNEGDYAGAQAEFARWNKAGGRVLQGLVKRRAAEAELYGRDA